MNIIEVLLAQQLGGGGSGGGITPEQLSTYVKNNTIKKVIETPITDDYEVGDLIFDLSDAQIKICASGQGGKSWSNVTQAWLNTFKQEVLDQLYQPKITAGAGLVFDGNTLKHSNSVTAKPQRYIRATAYDAEGHAINFGADYLVSRTDNNDNVISDSYLSSTLWVDKHYQSVVLTLNVVNPSDCLFNFPLSADVTTGSGSKVFFTQLTNLITGGTDYGFVTTVEKKNGNGNFYFEQTFRKEQQGNADSRIVYYRKGSIVNNTDVTVLNIYENRALITWGAWFPVEYPVTVFTSNNPDFSITSMSFYVSGGMVNIFINELSQLVASPASNIIATLPSCLKCKNGIGAHGMLINSDNFNSFATLSEIASNNTLMFRGGGTAGKYYGNLSYGIGY